MKSKWWLLFSVVMVSGAHAADDESLRQQVEMLSKRVGELERRLDAIESPEVREVIQQSIPPANAGDSSDTSNWDRLKVGLDYNEVRELLGEPSRTTPGDLELWFYSDKGVDGPFVKFLYRKVIDWSVP